jgi:hypothetical protein
VADLLDRVAIMQAKQAQAKQELAEQAQAKLARRDQVRLELRETMPEIATIVDQFRSVFGDGVRVTYAEENGQVKGRK